MPFSLPLIKTPIRTRGISQSIDSLSMPHLVRVEKSENKLRDIFDSVKEKAKALHDNIMSKLRSHEER